MKVLADFKKLTKAEGALVKWLQAGNRKFFRVSDSVPDGPSDAVTLRATFIRYLALGGCDTCRLPETGLRVWGAYIEGDDNNSDETKGLDFEGATLPYDLALMACHIPDPIILRSAKLKNLFLNGSDVKAEIAADRLQAEDDVFLREAKIAGEVRLLGARLGGNLDCDGAELQAEGRALSCALAKITGALYWRNGAKAKGCMDLTDASFGSICDDPACWPPEVVLDRCRYGAFLGLSPTEAKSRLKWLALQKPREYGHDFWPDPYEHCAKVLREMGHGADARAILIEKERLQRKAQRDREERDLAGLRADVPEHLNSTEALKRRAKLAIGAVRIWANRNWDNALGLLVGYGRKPLDALWRGLLPVWAIGTVIFFLASWTGEIKPNLPQTQVHPAWVDCADWGARRWASHATQVDCFRAQPEGKSFPHFNALFYSADTLFPVVSLEMQSYWIPDDTKPFGKYARWYLWAHIFAGWALTLLAVAGFSGLIKTDNTK